MILNDFGKHAIMPEDEVDGNNESMNPAFLRYGGGEEDGSSQQALREQFPFAVWKQAAVLVLWQRRMEAQRHHKT